MYADKDYIISLRREIHKHPEVGFDLPNTIAIVKRELDSMGIAYTEKYGKSSVVATINPDKSHFTIGIRADMDALLIQEKNEIFQRFPFQYAEYEQYCGMLITGMEMYAQAGDTASAQFCVQELIKTKNAVEGLGNRLSPLGRIIVDQPTTQLPEGLTAYIEALEAQQTGGGQ